MSLAENALRVGTVLLATGRGNEVAADDVVCALLELSLKHYQDLLCNTLGDGGLAL